MRPSQKSNRNRGKNNRPKGLGNVVNRVFESAGPEGKVRGTPQQIIDKYLSLARDSQTSGDRVMSENFLQHAEHYQRMLIQAAAVQEQSRRESADAATDYDGDGSEAGSDAGPAPARAERPMPQHSRSEARGAGAESAETGEIGGMTMIDSGNGGEDLLVASEDITQSQPRRNGDGRRRRAKPAAADRPEGEKRQGSEAEPEASPQTDS
jgi:hypothetical protein